MVNLEIIEAGHYFVEGSYGISETVLPLPFQVHISVELMPNALVIEGSWQQYSGRQTYAFKLQILRDHISQSQADIRIAGSSVIEMTGRASLNPPSYELLASDLVRGHQISAHLVPSETPGLFEISGFLTLGEEAWFTFHGRVVPMESRAALSNVVSLEQKSA